MTPEQHYALENEPKYRGWENQTWAADGNSVCLSSTLHRGQLYAAAEGEELLLTAADAATNDLLAEEYDLAPQEPLRRPFRELGSTLRTLAQQLTAYTIPDAEETETAAQIKRRTKQQLYRTKQLELWGHRCALTGCDLPELLIAGHAKPWADATPAERIDPYNGLPLEARFDRLFDQGLITFADDGTIRLSPALSTAQRCTLGLTPTLRLRAPLHPRHLPYLRYHREHIFQA